MAHPSWGPGWPTDNRHKMITVVTGGGGLRLPVRREIGPLVVGLVRDLERAENILVMGSTHAEVAGIEVETNPCRQLAVHMRQEIERIISLSDAYDPST